MKITESKLREIIREVLEELEEDEVDEATTTASMDGYQTPHAFSTKDEPDDDYVDRLNRSTGYTRVNESKLPVVSVNKKQYDGLESGKSVTVSRLSTGLRHNVDPKMYKRYPKNLKQIEILNPRTKKREVVNVEKVEHEDSGVYLTLVKESINENTAPKNWKKLTKEKEDEQEYKNRWLELKQSEGTPNQKIGVGIRKIRRELAEMEKFVTWYSRIRSMNELDKDDYWKRTQKHLKKIKERLIGFAHKIQELDRPISESVINESDDIVKITHGDNDWHMKRIDGTHVMSANNEKALRDGRGAVYHVAQFRDRPFYADVRKWLYGKKDIDGNFYKD